MFCEECERCRVHVNHAKDVGPRIYEKTFDGEAIKLVRCCKPLKS